MGYLLILVHGYICLFSILLSCLFIFLFYRMRMRMLSLGPNSLFWDLSASANSPYQREAKKPVFVIILMGPEWSQFLSNYFWWITLKLQKLRSVINEKCRADKPWFKLENQGKFNALIVLALNLQLLLLTT